MNNQIHTVLGASGAIGHAVIKALQDKNLPIRAVSGHSMQGVEWVYADLQDPILTQNAVQGSGYVYLCVGLPYDSLIWAAKWPVIMKNVINACEQSGSVLIFLDNVYMYDPYYLQSPFDENTPQHPSTKKGSTRKLITEMMLDAVKKKKIKAVIGRSADFYGPFSKNSPFYISFLERMLSNKNPVFLGNPDKTHTYAYTMDNGKALVLLALDPSTYGKVWHLPTEQPITIKHVTTIFNKVLGKKYEVKVILPILRKVLSLFSKTIREASEMNYQYEHDYIMISDQFKKHFPDFQTTPYESGIREMVTSFTKK
ncbi:NAD-dependent epimerase/dehydratase family protein [Chryseobacterium rhizosphaerae]|uniref:NAD-dependent epimerase/dehydratase family protein n=1 Tax=Chryseobacterium rhizosphaerae TaxID=395937 RepID=UPI0023599217|nr:NAD-dependent epimerase/dehydratase family protein [Chryseobacterium rhizosphaerae]MDC8101037.1 NAD-dependent epimerase/dehydratase family protein [Chryseobacterium rhizosphaerae]